MVPLCKYKNLFGEPNTGLHKYRIFNIAIFDTIIVILCAWFIAWFFKIPFPQTLVGIFLLGLIVHRIFCVKTGLAINLNKMFGKDIF